jgi:hypothetical protein
MQISHSPALPNLVISLEQQRDSAVRLTQAVPLASQVNGDSVPVVRSVEQVKQAEQMLARQRSQSRFSQISDDPQKQRALASYQSVQTNQERDYVSEVLGIDTYA